MEAPEKKYLTEKSSSAHEEAVRVLPGGVNSPVRAFGAVGGVPRFISRASGAVLKDLDGNEYIDFVGSWGPMILGHADERVVAAVSKAVQHGLSFGAPTVSETRLADLVVEAVPSVEMVRFVSSGTEAVMSATRLARGFTSRDLTVKVEGGYHGHSDSLLVAAGSGLCTFGTPSSAGVPAAMAGSTILVPYNDLEAMGAVFEKHGSEIASILVEPVCGNMGLVPPSDGYLAGLRELCDRHGALLVFDEVITGFRVGYGGAQSLFGVTPDLTCLGKVLGGGLPVGAYGGRRDIMEKVSPLGPVYQAGTLSGNPLSMAAGIATLEALQEPGFYDELEAKSALLEAGLRIAAEKAGVQTFHTRVGSVLGLFFTPGPVVDYVTASKSDTDSYALYFHAMLNRGIYLAPSQFECSFVSAAHTTEQIEAAVAAATEALQSVAERSGA